MGSRTALQPDYNMLRLALAEQEGNNSPGRTPSAIAMNAYLGSVPLSNEQQREQRTLDVMDDDYEAGKMASRQRSNAIEGAHTAATIRDFQRRTGRGSFSPVGTEEGGNVLLRKISPLGADGSSMRRASDSNSAFTDPDAAMGMTERALNDPRVIAARTTAGGRAAAEAAKAAAATAKKTGASADADAHADANRQEVIRLATEIRNSPYLNANVGPLDTWLPTVRGGSRDFQAKTQRLKNLLALENRSQLKGQGAVSDFEGRMLASSATALDNGMDEGSFMSELDRIIADKSKPAAKAGRKVYNPATGQID